MFCEGVDDNIIIRGNSIDMTEDNSNTDLSNGKIVLVVLLYGYFLLIVVEFIRFVWLNPGPTDGSTANATMRLMRRANASSSSIGTNRVKSSDQKSLRKPWPRSTKSTTKEKRNCVDSRAPKNHRDNKDEIEEEDRKFAQSLHFQEKLMSKKLADEQSQKAMMETNIGKAILLVERVVQLVESSEGECKIGLRPVAKDDMVILAERLFAKQDEFKAKGINSKVDIGYHYTTEENMREIQVNGLMTKKDRIKNNIDVKTNGAVFGDGVYTANNPTSFKNFGSVGLIVARMQGKTIRIAERLDPTKHPKLPNTIIGDKKAKSLKEWRPYSLEHEIILQESSQCVPLIRYDKNVMLNHSIIEMHILTASIETIVDEIFNAGETPKRGRSFLSFFSC